MLWQQLCTAVNAPGDSQETEAGFCLMENDAICMESLDDVCCEGMRSNAFTLLQHWGERAGSRMQGEGSLSSLHGDVNNNSNK